MPRTIVGSARFAAAIAGPPIVMMVRPILLLQTFVINRYDHSDRFYSPGLHGNRDTYQPVEETAFSSRLR
ncbi:MAG: hypothetical protein SFY81_12315, partial [Verrucomicrobiota bacterium]|nr:hypothetical protein [Verrucomicrobiota bacterium]